MPQCIHSVINMDLQDNLLQNFFLGTFMRMSLGANKYEFPLGTYPQERMLDSKVCVAQL